MTLAGNRKMKRNEMRGVETLGSAQGTLDHWEILYYPFSYNSLHKIRKVVRIKTFHDIYDSKENLL